MSSPTFDEIINAIESNPKLYNEILGEMEHIIYTDFHTTHHNWTSKLKRLQRKYDKMHERFEILYKFNELSNLMKMKSKYKNKDNHTFYNSDFTFMINDYFRNIYSAQYDLFHNFPHYADDANWNFDKLVVKAINIDNGDYDYKVRNNVRINVHNNINTYNDDVDEEDEEDNEYEYVDCGMYIIKKTRPSSTTSRQ